MLLQLSIENYKSIRERVVWSMLAAEGVEHRPGQVVEIPGIGKVLRVAGMYGPNASGKSAVVEAWDFFADLAVRGRKPEEGSGRIPFKLDPAWRSRPTTVEVVLALGDVPWTYGLSVGDEVVEEEWLLVGQHHVFSRRGVAWDRPCVDWLEGLQVDEERRKFLRFVAEGVRPNQPLLAELRDRNVEEVRNLHDQLWGGSFRFSPIYRTGGLDLESVIDICAASLSLRRHLLSFLEALGTGVVGVRFRSDDPVTQAELDQGREVPSDTLNRLRKEGRGVVMHFLHAGTGGVTLPLGWEDLSDGTQRLLGMSFGWRWAEQFGHLLVVDEINRSFHPSLTRTLLALLLEAEGPPRSQLLFTTHDTHLLDAGLLGPDAIWFIEKNPEGASRLYSLAEFDPGQIRALTGSLEAGYLQGRFGAIPFLGDPGRLGWVPEEPER